MSARCQVTGRTVQFGNSVSHSHRRTKRTFRANHQMHTYWVPSLGRKVTLRLSAKGMKIMDARGIDAVVAEMAARGERF